MIMVMVDYLMGIPSPKLNVPDRFEVAIFDFFLEASNIFTLFINVNICQPFFHFSCFVAAADVQEPRLVDGPVRRKSLVDAGGGSTSCSALHHPHLYGPADNCSHHKPQGAQAQGQSCLSWFSSGVKYLDFYVI